MLQRIWAVLQKEFMQTLPNIGTLPISTSARILYNPNVDEIIFLIPGLAAMLLQLIGVNATVMSIVRERELETMEQNRADRLRHRRRLTLGGDLQDPVGLR